MTDLTAAEARHQEFLAMSEAELQSEVLELAALYGWRGHAERPARTGRTYVSKDNKLKEVWNTPLQGDKGFPDLVLLRDRSVSSGAECVVAELKRHGRKPTPEQEKWLRLWRRLGVEVYIWRPEQLETGEIEKALR